MSSQFFILWALRSLGPRGTSSRTHPYTPQRLHQIFRSLDILASPAGHLWTLWCLFGPNSHASCEIPRTVFPRRTPTNLQEPVCVKRNHTVYFVRTVLNNIKAHSSTSLRPIRSHSILPGAGHNSQKGSNVESRLPSVCEEIGSWVMATQDS